MKKIYFAVVQLKSVQCWFRSIANIINY